MSLLATAEAAGCNQRLRTTKIQFITENKCVFKHMLIVFRIKAVLSLRRISSLIDLTINYVTDLAAVKCVHPGTYSTLDLTLRTHAQSGKGGKYWYWNTSLQTWRKPYLWRQHGDYFCPHQWHPSPLQDWTRTVLCNPARSIQDSGISNSTNSVSFNIRTHPSQFSIKDALPCNLCMLLESCFSAINAHNKDYIQLKQRNHISYQCMTLCEIYMTF